jgi:hypothetical protein
MDITQISIIGGFTISILSIFSGVFISWITKRNELRREICTIVYNLAFKEWEIKSKQATEIAEKTGRSLELHPFDEYLFYYSGMVKLLYKGNVRQKDITKFFEENTKTRKLIKLEREKYTKYN